MDGTDIGKLKDRMWITERCHMKAEKRKRFLEFYFHIALALFALASIAISLFQSEPSSTQFGTMMTFTSICTLSISLLIFGFRFGETAAQHRSCYLDLQRLRISEDLDIVQLNKKYIDTLCYYPNHSNLDFMDVAVSNIFFAKQALKDSNGSQISYSLFSRATYSFHWLVVRLLLVTFLLAPITFAVVATGLLRVTFAIGN
jgi:hypothetical protein